MKSIGEIKKELQYWNDQLDFNTRKAIYFDSTGNESGYQYYRELKEKCLTRINTLEWVLE